MKRHAQLKLLAVVVMAAGSFNCAVAVEIEGGATTMAKPMSSKLGMVTQKRLNNAHSDKANWLHVNGGYEQTRYYPGSQIDTGNVSKLRPAFVFQVALIESLETAPLIIDEDIAYGQLESGFVSLVDPVGHPPSEQPSRRRLSFQG